MSETALKDEGRAAYVITTAAWNEEAQIERVVGSVIAQTVLPLRWVIVSDASTDRTDDIVRKYAEQYDFIELHRINDDHPRNFAAQVNAINAGFARLRGMEYDFIGNLDSDISFEPTYFEKLLDRFDQDPMLGLAGGWIHEEQQGAFKPRRHNNPSGVPHAVQLFRRECFQRLGGYVPLPYGGSDWHAEVRSRMAGWHVQSFPDLKVFHHRPAGGAEGCLRSWYRMGLMDYALGSHPLFEIVRLARRVRSRPYVLAAFVRFCAFVWANCGREKRPVSEEFVKYIRREELGRLWRFGRSGLRG